MTSKTQLPSSDQCVKDLHERITNFRETILQGDVADMSKKELQRMANSFRRILLECAEYPVERTQDDLTQQEQTICRAFSDIQQTKFLLLATLDNERGVENLIGEGNVEE